jgi:hypothetical protein
LPSQTCTVSPIETVYVYTLQIGRLILRVIGHNWRFGIERGPPLSIRGAVQGLCESDGV